MDPNDKNWTTPQQPRREAAKLLLLRKMPRSMAVPPKKIRKRSRRKRRTTTECLRSKSLSPPTCSSTIAEDLFSSKSTQVSYSLNLPTNWVDRSPVCLLFNSHNGLGGFVILNSNLSGGPGWEFDICNSLIFMFFNYFIFTWFLILMIYIFRHFTDWYFKNHWRWMETAHWGPEKCKSPLPCNLTLHPIH